MIDSYDNFSKEEINLMKDLIVFLREPKKYENEKLNNFYIQLQWKAIYNKNGLKTKEDIQKFSEKLCNANLATPWYLNHEKMFLE